ncbi:MAG: outer membrane receptor protein involved in Fe transport [Sphingobacteriales bacterium]|jgi:outer membrane receptor protein involved in Fe transport
MKNLLTLIVAIIVPFGVFAQSGSIKGKVTDKEAAFPLIGVTVIIEGTTNGSVVDFDGNFSINNLKPGKYNVVASYMSYKTKKFTDVQVKAGQAVKLDFQMEPSLLEIGEVMVQARRIENTENSLLAIQAKAITIQDGISSQEMAKYGSSNAAESMQKISGATVVGGKFVVVRGLGDRYTNTQLNGQNLSGTDPYKNSVQMDLIPSNMLDNIIVSKTFTPDQPANFTGGNINITTKNFPEKLTLGFSTSMGYNTETSLSDNFLTHSTGDNAWIGFDRSRELPELLKDPSVTQNMVSSFPITARKSDSLAAILDATSKSINSSYTTTTKSTPLNSGMAFSMGNQFPFLGKTLGVFGGLNYNKSYSGFENGTSAGWELSDRKAEELNRIYEFDDHKSVESPQVGGLFKVALKLNPNHIIGFNAIYNHDAEIVTRYQSGSYPGVISDSRNVFETRTLHYLERELETYQIEGKHTFNEFKGLEMNWSGGYTESSQHEPDLKFFASDRRGDSLHFISPSEYDLPFHYFRDLVDNQYQARIDFSLPILQEMNKENMVKFGSYYSTKDRKFTENRFQVQSRDGERYNGDVDAYFADANTGIIGYDSARNRQVFGNFMTDETILSNQYQGNESITSFYAMTVLRLAPKLQFIGGARIEKTDILVSSADTTKETGEIKKFDILPSLNLVYNLTEKMNIRGSYTHTLARPNMRELAPFVSFDFIGGFVYVGNPNLERTQIKNYDLRYEYYPAPGDVFAVSSYLKQFENPIIKTFSPVSSNPEIQFQNVAEAKVYGLEFELRKGLGIILPELQNLKLGANVSLIKSKVDIDSTEFKIISDFNPEFENSRPFQDQSPFIVNANLSYSSDSLGLDVVLSVNIYGKRLAEVGLNGTPDIYESSRQILDLSVKKSLGENVKLKFGVNNILNSGFSKELEYNNKAYIFQSYNVGRTFSLGLSYSL